MSRLQTALRALPPGSVVTPQMLDDNKKVNAELDAERNLEIQAAQTVFKSQGCTWDEAISRSRGATEASDAFVQHSRENTPVEAVTIRTRRPKP